MPQRHHRIDAHGTTCRENARRDRNEGKKQGNSGECQGIEGTDAVEKAGEIARCAQRCQNAKHRSGGGQPHSSTHDQPQHARRPAKVSENSGPAAKPIVACCAFCDSHSILKLVSQ